MTDYMDIINKALVDATNKTVEITTEMDLVKDGILDSLDSAVFLLNIEKATSASLPEKEVEEGDLFNVGKLIEYLEKQ